MTARFVNSSRRRSPMGRGPSRALAEPYGPGAGFVVVSRTEALWKPERGCPVHAIGKGLANRPHSPSVTKNSLEIFVGR